MFLSLAGHEVEAVGDGAEALASAPVFAPEVVVLDIGLPLVDGYEVARRLRQVPQTRDSFVVALTGYGQRADRERAQEAGFDRHLTKPAEPDELPALIAARRSELADRAQRTEADRPAAREEARRR